MFVLWLILAALAVLVAVVLVRTVRFTPGPAPAMPAGEETIDREFAPLEAVRDNHPKHVLTLDEFPRERNGIRSENLIDWLLED